VFVRLLLAAALIAVLAVPAAAQVAAPDLVPAAYRTHFFMFPGYDSATITPDNPAALQWSNTLVAVGVINQHFENPLGSPLPAHGTFGGARLVWSRVAIGGEYVDLQNRGGNRYERIHNEHLALKLSDWLSLGVAHDFTHVSTFPSTFIETTSTLYGVSLRLGGVLYIGAAKGGDRYRNDGGQEARRGARMYGIALHTEGDWRWHVAYDVISRDDFYSGGTLLGWDLTTRNYTVQTIAHGLLVGLGYNVPSQPTFFTYAPTETLDLGWVPAKDGLTVSLRASKSESHSPGSVFARDKTYSAAIGQVF
jgi:hypothetical protein